MTSETFYTITSPFHKKVVKIGFTTQTREQLIRRYITAIPGVEIKIWFPCRFALSLETYLKKEALKKKRIINVNGQESEWVVTSVDEVHGHIKTYLDTIIKQVDDFQKQYASQQQSYMNRLYSWAVNSWQTPFNKK